MENTQLIKNLILETIQKNEGYCDWRLIRSGVGLHYFSKRLLPIPTDKQITHIAYLLAKDDAVERHVELPEGIFYRITPWGHALLGPWYKKWFYFLIYKNTNLIAVIALILSAVAILFSDRVWIWLELLFMHFY